MNNYQVWSYIEGCVDISEHRRIADNITETHALEIVKTTSIKSDIKYIRKSLRDVSCLPINYYVRKYGDPTYLINITDSDRTHTVAVCFNPAIAQKRIDILNSIYVKNKAKKIAAISERDDRDIRGELHNLAAQRLMLVHDTPNCLQQ
jgi:hypothetical protein